MNALQRAHLSAGKGSENLPGGRYPTAHVAYAEDEAERESSSERISPRRLSAMGD